MKRFLGIVIWMALVVALFCCCGKQGEEEAHRSGSGVAKPWQTVDTCMGTVVQQTIYATDQDTAIAFSEQVMELLTHLEKEEISWRLDTSQVYQANASAGSREGFVLSEDMADLLEACLELYEKSDGALDVTLGTVTGLWNMDKWAVEDGYDFSPPGKEELEKALSLCGGEKVKLELDAAGNRVLFLPQGMQLDLGAVGKGYAMEKLSILLAGEPNVTGAVISLGGSILTYGEKPDGGPWRVGIIDPFDTSDSIGILTLEGQWCISTSGDYERYVEVDGVRYHHILDPKTGAPAASQVRGVTVLLKDGLLSDGLSTACYILGPEKGMALAEEYGAETMFVMADGRIEMSDGIKKYFRERSGK